MGCVFSGKCKSGFPYPKTDHESIKSTLRVDSSDQTQVRIFQIHNLNVFFGLGRIWKKYFWQAVFQRKKRYPTDAVHVWLLTECWWRLINFMPLVTYHSILRETFVFQIDTDINFAYSFVAYVAFSSVLSSPRGSVFFLPTRSTRTCRFMVNDPISDPLFFGELRISITWDHKSVFGFSQNNAPQPWCRASFISSCWFCSTRLVKVGLWPWYTKMGITLYLYVD